MTDAGKRAEALRMAAEGTGPTAIARALGVGRSTVNRWLAHPGPAVADPVSHSAAEVSHDGPVVGQRGTRTDHPVAHSAPSVSQAGGTVWTVVHGLSPREADALGAYLAVKGRTIEGWLAELAARVARDVLHQADRAQAVAVIDTGVAPRTFVAPKCPRCGGAVLVDQTGRRCLNRGCDWTGKA